MLRFGKRRASAVMDASLHDFCRGPILGPVLGGFIGEASMKGIISWRWTEWVTLIWSGLILGTMILVMPETYAPTLMKWKVGADIPTHVSGGRCAIKHYLTETS
jgi:MFS family permease